MSNMSVKLKIDLWVYISGSLRYHHQLLYKQVFGFKVRSRLLTSDQHGASWTYGSGSNPLRFGDCLWWHQIIPFGERCVHGSAVVQQRIVVYHEGKLSVFFYLFIKRIRLNVCWATFRIVLFYNDKVMLDNRVLNHCTSKSASFKD